MATTGISYGADYIQSAIVANGNFTNHNRLYQNDWVGEQNFKRGSFNKSFHIEYVSGAVLDDEFSGANLYRAVYSCDFLLSTSDKQDGGMAELTTIVDSWSDIVKYMNSDEGLTTAKAVNNNIVGIDMIDCMESQWETVASGENEFGLGYAVLKFPIIPIIFDKIFE